MELRFKKIYDSLRKGGVFINCDVVKSGSKFSDRQTVEMWKDRLRERGYNDKEMEGWFRFFDHRDRPSTLEDQLKWLKETSFRDVDCIWKRFNNAIYIGFKK